MIIKRPISIHLLCGCISVPYCYSLPLAPTAFGQAEQRASVLGNSFASFLASPRMLRGYNGEIWRIQGCESDTGAARRASKPGVTAPTVASKRCRRCGLEKPAVDFPRKKERSDGLDSYCKACNCAATSERTQRKGPVLEPLVASKVAFHPPPSSLASSLEI